MASGSLYSSGRWLIPSLQGMKIIPVGATCAMHIETFSVGPLGCNCSILADLEAKRAIVIDPGGDFDEIRSRLEPFARRAALASGKPHLIEIPVTKTGT